MGSRKEEERNEKIIRGLMKLPPNRRCMNCNSLGPQYVCTNFWTFVCVTCSGIHREFTHRVKSVSMAKFTSQEVEALQKGGNQRAREAFLKDWDPQRQRLPDSSNADKVREFIKNVYVDRRYAGGKTSDKPPRDMQNLRHHEDETRRASSYHSYSQSPPYDYQYEERRYGKQAHALTRKPGSDRGLYEGRLSSFFSPSRISDQMHEDSFANEGSNPRASDYSVSSAGDPFRSDATQSPNFQRDIGMRSPPQRTASLGSPGSFDSNSVSLKSVNSGSLADVSSEPAESAGTHQYKQYAVPSLPQSSVSGNFGGLDLFNAPFVPQSVNSAIDLFQSPEIPSTPPVDLFQPSSNSSVLSLHAHQPSQTIPPSLNTFDMPQQQPAAISDKKSQEDVITKNERWATFDLPQFLAPNLGVDNSIPAVAPPTGGGVLGKFDSLLLSSATLQWPAFDDSNAQGPSSMPNLWHEGLNNVQVSDNAMSAQSWNAFEDPTGNLPLRNIQQSTEEVAVNAPSRTTVNQHLSGIYGDGIQRAALDSGPPIPSVPLHVNGSSYTPPSIPSTVGAQSHATDRKSTNPFDLPYESDLESSSMFLDMSSLQAALPSDQIPNSFLDGVTQPWFPQNPVTPYVPATQQGALGFMGGQAPNTQLPNVTAQGPLASVGGNPFA
ncbi:probable ADP-ribosylation factor GTPase-activating protein AGD14 isoform X2 [Actinidia eriantha]|uniref:probable ADP-ribosylation factor GTPase-activating protein AGD14 isoform X2 n=1 Tax=Actinidia eriantha TaxID=165200 RepID=UPI00258A82D0|nr:probable ADP-ribosylation factor GTPase-activating protein AGD14 isoform X2 [Actinidia eriantha]